MKKPLVRASRGAELTLSVHYVGRLLQFADGEMEAREDEQLASNHRANPATELKQIIRQVCLIPAPGCVLDAIPLLSKDRSCS